VVSDYWVYHCEYFLLIELRIVLHQRVSDRIDFIVGSQRSEVPKPGVTVLLFPLAFSSPFSSALYSSIDSPRTGSADPIEGSLRTQIRSVEEKKTHHCCPRLGTLPSGD
jgi:hypothetical protein